ncbi:TonB-dependent receptor [Draconibacterium sediminis]|uniref:TonB-dependent receptor n=1 Tax=Draconibacterium sediminis TaxID=1544798 RepID=UPI0026EE898C|nr:TonB-dependent receptor [Draconibacterium sediminis]
MKNIFLVISILFAFNSLAQNSVTFTVKDENDEILTGANIVIEGTTTGTVSDENGIAVFNDLANGKTVFVISFIGYEKSKVVLVFPQDNKKSITVELEEGEELEEVIVAATRSSRTIEDIPTRVEAITGEELGEQAAMNSSNIGMLLKETTGVQMQQTSLSSGNMSIRIQGLDGRYTQILKDGLPLYGGFAGGLSIMQIPPLDLKQVELIKGSNSTLYGGGAIAGLVNLVSITPEDKPELSLMFNQTSALGSTANFFYAQKFSKTGITIYGSADKQVPYDPDDDGFSNLPKSTTYNLNPKFYFYPNSNTEILFGISSAFDTRTGGDMEVIKHNATQEHVFSEKNKSERYSTQFKIQNINDVRSIAVKNSVSYFNRELNIPDYQFAGKQLSGFSEINYSLYKKEKSDWQLGANHYFEQFKETNVDASAKRDYTHNTLGIFAQNTSDFGPKFTFEGGLRTDSNFDYGMFVLPRIALLFKATEKFSSRIGGAMGYKLPSIFTEDAEKLYFRNIQPISSGEMNPEKSVGGNFDLNYKTVFFDAVTFSINQLFYITQLKDALVLRENQPDNTYFFENADGNILSSGFETNGKLSYADFKLYFNYAFINTKLQYDNINNQKPLTPKHNIGLALMYETEEKWSVGYELYYTGSQFDEQYNTKPDYWMMGFMAMRHFKRLSVFINFENFTDVIQTNYEPLVLPPYNSPTFPDIWAPSDGFVFNGGIRINLL